MQFPLPLSQSNMFPYPNEPLPGVDSFGWNGPQGNLQVSHPPSTPSTPVVAPVTPSVAQSSPNIEIIDSSKKKRKRKSKAPTPVKPIVLDELSDSEKKEDISYGNRTPIAENAMLNNGNMFPQKKILLAIGKKHMILTLVL